VHLDATAFYSRYRNLRTLVSDRTLTFENPWLFLEGEMVFAADARVRGAEATLDWQPSTRWRMRFSYTRLEPDVIPTGDAFADSASRSYLRRVPKEQFSVHSTWKPMYGHAIDFVVRHVGDLARKEEDSDLVSAYTELDVGYAWRYSAALSFSLVGRNLLDGRHAEFGRDYMPNALREIERSVHASMQWSFD